MGKRSRTTLARIIRQQGIRVNAGPWTACAKRAVTGNGRAILALGRVAGGAVARSRIRRIARGVLATEPGRPSGADLLLFARSDVSRQPRRRLRASLAEILGRIASALSRRGLDGSAHG